MLRHLPIASFALVACCSSPSVQPSTPPAGEWYEVIAQRPGVAVTDLAMRQKIKASGLPWKVRDRTTGIEMILVMPGEFLMGSPQAELGRFENEGPQHRVRLTKAFYLGATEVTQRQWQRLMGPSYNFFEGESKPRDASWELIQGFLDNVNARHPAGHAAMRLPTEAEWEYACRAGSSGPFNFEQSIWHSLVNFCDGDAESARVVDGKLIVKWTTPPAPECPVSTVDAGSLPPNAWGFHEMHGNLLEFCADMYSASGYAVDDLNGVTIDPFEKATRDDARTLRGGSWYDSARYCRSSVRDAGGPSVRSNRIGFRVIRSL
jgi:formylglycine-generating enzyme required for sulfatase activity